MKSINLLGATLLASTALLGAGNVFANDSSTPDPASASTPVEVTLSPRDLTGEVPTPPTPNPGDPNNPGGGDDSSETLTGPFGIAYAPAKLVQKEETVELGKSANQMVNLKSSKGDTVINLNVGVRDETAKTGRNWTFFENRLYCRHFWEVHCFHQAINTTNTNRNAIITQKNLADFCSAKTFLRRSINF